MKGRESKDPNKDVMKMFFFLIFIICLKRYIFLEDHLIYSMIIKVKKA